MKKTKWELFEELTRDDLIIELVKSRYQYECLRESIRSYLENGREFTVPDIGEVPTKEWLDKIIKYASEHGSEEFSMMDLIEYGVDYDTADRLWKEE